MTGHLATLLAGHPSVHGGFSSCLTVLLGYSGMETLEVDVNKQRFLDGFVELIDGHDFLSDSLIPFCTCANQPLVRETVHINKRSDGAAIWLNTLAYKSRLNWSIWVMNSTCHLGIWVQTGGDISGSTEAGICDSSTMFHFYASCYPTATSIP